MRRPCSSMRRRASSGLEELAHSRLIAASAAYADRSMVMNPSAATLHRQHAPRPRLPARRVAWAVQAEKLGGLSTAISGKVMELRSTCPSDGGTRSPASPGSTSPGCIGWIAGRPTEHGRRCRRGDRPLGDLPPSRARRAKVARLPGSPGGRASRRGFAHFSRRRRHGCTADQPRRHSHPRRATAQFSAEFERRSLAGTGRPHRRTIRAPRPRSGPAAAIAAQSDRAVHPVGDRHRRCSTRR
jgi:hypothetical protein